MPDNVIIITIGSLNKEKTFVVELQAISTFEPEAKFIAVANTGPLVSIFQCRIIVLLEIYFEQIHIPVSIVQELEKYNASELLDRLIYQGIVIVHHLTEMEKSEATQRAIETAASPPAKDKEPISHLAEAETIVFMQRLLPITNYTLLDELASREIAGRCGLPVTGFAGILIMACRDKLISPEQVRQLPLICQAQFTL
jgi:predicted nucleic acid-binding protein